MKQYVYSLYSAYIGAYDKPFVHELGPDAIKEGYRRTIMQDPDQAFKNFAHEKILCLVGTWDDETGKFEPSGEDASRIVDLATLFPVGYIAAHARQE